MVGQKPNYIQLPPSPFSIDDHDDDQFHTAPSTPDLSSPGQFYTPPTSPLPLSPPSVDFAIDLALSDDSLSALEKIYLFSRSKALFHRVFIAHALPSFLDHVSPQDANEYVLPLLTGLAMDDEEQVKEALAADLVPVIWWFFSHCQVIQGDLAAGEQIIPTTAEVTISVQAFTPILGTLLLSPNPHVGGAARYAVVDLLDRIRKADDNDTRASPGCDSIELVDPQEIDLNPGLFGRQERALFQDEILQQVVIGMSYLDLESEYTGTVPLDTEEGPSIPPENGFASGVLDQWHDHSADVINPYFPHNVLPSLDSSAVKIKNSTSHSSPIEAYNPFQPYNVPSDTLFTKPTTSTDQPHSPLTIAHPTDNATFATNQHISHLNPPTQGRLSPDIIDALPSSPFAEKSRTSMEYDVAHDRILGSSWKCTCDDPHDHDECGDQKAAVGRLSSMSLMAAVAASGSLGEETKRAFVREVERVGRDPISWVRTEASFALGALAKIVPEEIVHCSLLPLFDQLRLDSAWRVRHSAVFALSAILARLRPHERRKLAMDTVIELVVDESATVRLGVLEVLGEVLYTFREDEDGVPEDLLKLFMGRKIHQSSHPSLPNRNHSLDLFLQEPKRPLICAFNYPAIALALGKERWKDVRSFYLSLAADTDFKIRRTLAASLGELAKIIGQDNAQRDLIQVWWDAVRADAEEIRLKALEAVAAFTAALDRRAGAVIVQGILTIWDEGVLKTWRERDCVAKSLETLSQWGHQDIPLVIHGLLQRALEDTVAAVRESAAAGLPHIRKIFADQPDFLTSLHSYVLSLAEATSYRRRMTFITCQQALITHRSAIDSDTLNAIAKLADDRVDGVRIGIARLVACIYEKRVLNVTPITDVLLTVINSLSQDRCSDVRAYVPNVTTFSHDRECTAFSKARTPDIFSRPPASRLLLNRAKMDISNPHHGCRQYDSTESQLEEPHYINHSVGT